MTEIRVTDETTTVIKVGTPGPEGPPGDGGEGGTGDHGALTGLGDDDHTQYHNNTRGDARYSLLNHEHPEYASFTYSVGFGDVTGLGGTYNIDGTVTLTALAGFGIPPNETLKVLLRSSPDSAFDAGYSYPTAADPLENTWILQPYDMPFTFGNVGKVISVMFNMPTSDSLLGLITYDGTFGIKAVEWSDHEHDGTYSPTAHDHDGVYVPIGGAGIDVRRYHADSLQLLWDDLPYKLRASPDPTTIGGFGSTWEITNGSTGTGTLPHTPTGVDIRMFFQLDPNFRDADLPGTGQDYPYQQFRELLTQTKIGATGGDLSEWAILTGSTHNEGDGIGTGTWFWESTITGAAGEQNFTVDDGSQLMGVPVMARLTLDCANSRVRFWRWIPYNIDPDNLGADAVTEETDDGYRWMVVAENVDPKWASMREDVTVETWKIGIQNNFSVAWCSMHHFGGAKILDIRQSDIATAFGTTTFVDGSGNTIATTYGDIIGPEFASVDHDHDADYGIGDILGPASSLNNQPALYDGTTGKLLKAGSVAGTAVSIDATYFNGNLTVSDDTVQELAQRFDDFPLGGVTSIDYVVSGDVSIAVLENALSMGSFKDNTTFLLGYGAGLTDPAVLNPGSDSDFLLFYPGGVVTGATNKGIYDYDGIGNLTLQRDLDVVGLGTLGEFFFTDKVINEDADFLGALGHHALSLSVTISGMATTVLASEPTQASTVTVDASGFNGNLTTTDNTLQEIVQKLDDLTITGDVIGPASAVNDKVALFDGTTGKLLKDSGVTLGTAAAAAVEDFAAHHPPASFFTISGNQGYGIPGFTPTSSGGAAAVSTNRLQFQPFVVYRTINITKMAVEVTTAGSASSLMRVGIFEDAGNFVLGDLVVDAGTLAMDPGSVPTLQSAVINVTLQPGRYIGVHITNGSPSCRTYNGYVDGFPHMNGIASANTYVYSVYLSGQSATVAGGFASIASGTAFDNQAALNTGYTCVYIIRYQWSTV